VQTGMIRTELAPDASCADLIRASIVFVKSFCEEGWIAGSSPAMTGASTFSSCPRLARASMSCFFVRQRRGCSGCKRVHARLPTRYARP
jgi:hypothetical protein